MTKYDIEKRKQILEIGMAIVIGGLILSFILFIPLSVSVGPVMIIPWIVLGIATAWISHEFKKLSVLFKEIYVKDMLKAHLEDAYYSPKEGFSKEEVYGSRIVHKEDRFRSEDMIEGDINGFRFKCSDILLQDVRSNGKSTTVVTVFQGRFFEVETNMKIDSPTYIMKNHTYSFALGEGFKRIDLEWVDFNNAFDGFSKDEHETFLLLKPRFMEKLMSFKPIYKDIRFAFLDHQVMIAINNKKDNFDLKMFRPIDNSFLDSIEQDLKNIKELIETLTEK